MSASKGMQQRRIVALERSCTRRRRLGETLRAALAAQRNAHAPLEAARDAKQAQFAHETGVLRFYEHRMDGMMTGTEPFSLDDFNNCRLYIGVVNDRLRLLEAELAQAEAAVQANLAAIAQTQREIALNQGRIDLCGERIHDIRRAQDNAESDASDEEAEETALARRFHARGAHA
ncbi:type III secretion protein HrpB7 [Paraburkholderia bryophila]|uniref:Type III secretion system HrpB7-like protein n=1 Tax=Paraburkholderia bryophila TaxID=420952 RepID=A0A7Y9WP42_9BURK|nr:type III secretion protein HrpB7 [Paraburkholderia bryophila]NYH24509.1 type III secretion system HrpB7-like protein [Paraburkholderia bryophila]